MIHTIEKRKNRAQNFYLSDNFAGDPIGPDISTFSSEPYFVDCQVQHGSSVHNQYLWYIAEIKVVFKNWMGLNGKDK